MSDTKLPLSDHDLLIKVATDTHHLRTAVGKIEAHIQKDLVTRAEFEPVKKMFYWVLGIGTTTVTIGILTVAKMAFDKS